MFTVDEQTKNSHQIQFSDLTVQGVLSNAMRILICNNFVRVVGKN